MPTGILRLPWLRFFRAFSSVVRQMPGYNTQRGGTARTLPKFLCCSMYCFVSLCALFVCKCVLYYCHRVATQLQLTNISYRIIKSEDGWALQSACTQRQTHALYDTVRNRAQVLQSFSSQPRIQTNWSTQQTHSEPKHKMVTLSHSALLLSYQICETSLNI